MTRGTLKKAMAEGGVFFDPVQVVEKEDMVQIFLNSGRLIVLPEESVEEEMEDGYEDISAKKYWESREMHRNASVHSTSGSMDLDTSLHEDHNSSHGMEEPSTHYIPQEPQDSSPFQSNPNPNPSIPSPTSNYPTNATSQTTFSTYSISQLKSFARQLNININGCIEKREMIERIVNAVEHDQIIGAPPRQRRRV